MLCADLLKQIKIIFTNNLPSYGAGGWAWECLMERTLGVLFLLGGRFPGNSVCHLDSTAHPDGGTSHDPEMMLASFSENLKEIKFMMINIFEGHYINEIFYLTKFSI